MVKDLEKTLWSSADKLRYNMDAAELRLQFAQSNELQNRIKENLAKIGIDL